MSTLEFDRTAHQLRLLNSDSAIIAGPFVACNNVDSHSQGPWPDGNYPYLTYLPHAELADLDSEYGSFGILIFTVPDRIGMGVHSGRQNIPDGLGRVGPQHCTLGCIRTTDESMKTLLDAIAQDPLAAITVRSALLPEAAFAPAASATVTSRDQLRKPKKKAKPADRRPKRARRPRAPRR